MKAGHTIRITLPQETTCSESEQEIIVTIHGAHIGSRHELDRRQGLSIGRDLTCDLSINEESVSRQHCKLFYERGAWNIMDLGSTNGTYVAGQMVREAILTDGVLIKIGSCIYKYLSASNVEAAYYEEIYRMAIFDGLTQIHNRRYFVEYTEREISRCLRHERHLSLILFDIDHFKKINDTFGHLSGDHVLRTLAARISKRMRKEELFARYAGDEFVIVLPESEVNEALKFAEMLCVIIQEESFYFDRQAILVSISLGVAGLSSEMKSPKQLLDAADKALYRAKESGRNRASL